MTYRFDISKNVWVWVSKGVRLGLVPVSKEKVSFTSLLKSVDRTYSQRSTCQRATMLLVWLKWQKYVR